MAFNRFTGERGGVIRLNVTFSKDGTLSDPYNYNALTVDILDSSDNLVVGDYFGQTSIGLSGLSPTRNAAGDFYYDFQSISGMSIGTYKDRWNNIQFTAGDTITSGVFAFTVRYNTEDLSDWDVLPG